MEITIRTTPEEIAGLVLALQDRQAVDDLASRAQEALQERFKQAEITHQGVLSLTE